MSMVVADFQWLSLKYSFDFAQILHFNDLQKF